MKRFSGKLYNLVSGKTVIIASVIFVLFVAIANPLAANYMDRLTGGAPSPDTAFIYNAGELFDMAQSYGQEGRNGYILMRFTFDLAFPLIYLFFLAAAATKLLSHFPKNSGLRLLNLLPFLAAGFDLVENILVAIVMGVYPKGVFWAIKTVPYISMVKWLFIISSFLLIGTLFCYLSILWIKRK